jgi:hypothetical protein
LNLGFRQTVARGIRREHTALEYVQPRRRDGAIRVGGVAPDKRDDECGRCASPLYPAERHRLEYSGQRILGRVQVRHAISIWTTWHRDTPIVGEMRNLSLNGMAFDSSQLFEVNQIVRVDCTELRALGRIAHAEQATSGAYPFSAGLEFLTLRLPEGGGTFYSSKK